MELENSTVLITGGTSGIGLEFVRQLSRKDSVNIIITGRDLLKLEQVKSQFPKIHILQSDVSDPKDIEQLYNQVIQQFPDLNIVINNAGIMRIIDLQDQSNSLENLTSEIDINLSGAIWMVHQFLPYLKTKKTAAIINISSGLAFVPFPLSPIYSASKSGLHAYTQTLRLQLKKTRVKVFELLPPSTQTPLLDKFNGLASDQNNMKVDKMVGIAIRGISKDKMEIRPGQSNLLKIMSRVAPNFILKMFGKMLDKAKSK
jgi:uncharacterized oxidoreductase